MIPAKAEDETMRWKLVREWTPGHLPNGWCLQRKGHLPKLISLICQPDCMLSYIQLLWRSVLWIIRCTIACDWIGDNIPWSTHLTWTIHLFNMPNNRIGRHNELHSFMYLRNWFGCAVFSPFFFFFFQVLSLVNLNVVFLEDKLVKIKDNCLHMWLNKK